MSGTDVAPASSRPPRNEPAGSRRYLERQQWRQLAWITAVALAIFVGFRLLPTGTNLSHMDFRVDPKSGNTIEFCDPLNPQFIPVVTARSPVTMTLATDRPAMSGRAVHATVKLMTGSGKPLAPEDLLVTHTRRLHLLIIDPSLRDYQHVHPEPTRQPGVWAFAFTPRAAGTYRVFADFTPAATARGLYASTELPVAMGAGEVPAKGGVVLTNSRGTTSGSSTARTEAGPPRMTPPSVPAVSSEPAAAANRPDYAFSLTTAQPPPCAGKPIDLRFTVTRKDGGPLQLERVMDALAHLVAFDRALTGFAHLHPVAMDLSRPANGPQQALDFKLTIPRAGDYVVWAQVNAAGEDVFVPFELKVEEP